MELNVHKKLSEPFGRERVDGHDACRVDCLREAFEIGKVRVPIHPESYEKEGFHLKGLKSKANESVRMFIRARMVDANGDVKEVDRASGTLEVIIDHLCRYVDTVIDILDANHAVSVLEEPTRPRPERI